MSYSGLMSTCSNWRTSRIHTCVAQSRAALAFRSMKRPDIPKFLGDALRAAREAQQFVGNRSSEEYIADALIVAAVERKLTIVGEALWRVDKLDPSIAQRISDVRDAIAFRHRLVHGYEHISSKA